MVESLTLYCLNFLLILLALFLWITEWNIFIVCGVLLLIINLNNFKFVKFFNLFYFFSLLLYVFFDVNLIEKFLFFFIKFTKILYDQIRWNPAECQPPRKNSNTEESTYKSHYSSIFWNSSNKRECQSVFRDNFSDKNIRDFSNDIKYKFYYEEESEKCRNDLIKFSTSYYKNLSHKSMTPSFKLYQNKPQKFTELASQEIIQTPFKIAKYEFNDYLKSSLKDYGSSHISIKSKNNGDPFSDLYRK